MWEVPRSLASEESVSILAVKMYFPLQSRLRFPTSGESAEGRSANCGTSRLDLSVVDPAHATVSSLAAGLSPHCLALAVRKEMRVDQLLEPSCCVHGKPTCG